MALIECPECKREISDKAGSCPGCGCPVENDIPKIEEQPSPAMELNRTNLSISPVDKTRLLGACPNCGKTCAFSKASVGSVHVCLRCDTELRVFDTYLEGLKDVSMEQGQSSSMTRAQPLVMDGRKRTKIDSEVSKHQASGTIHIITGVIGLIIGIFTIPFIIGIFIIIGSFTTMVAGRRAIDGEMRAVCPHCESDLVVTTKTNVSKCPHCKSTIKKDGDYLIGI